MPQCTVGEAAGPLWLEPKLPGRNPPIKGPIEWM